MLSHSSICTSALPSSYNGAKSCEKWISRYAPILLAVKETTAHSWTLPVAFPCFLSCISHPSSRGAGVYASCASPSPRVFHLLGNAGVGTKGYHYVPAIVTHTGMDGPRDRDAAQRSLRSLFDLAQCAESFRQVTCHLWSRTLDLGRIGEASCQMQCQFQRRSPCNISPPLEVSAKATANYRSPTPSTSHAGSAVVSRAESDNIMTDHLLRCWREGGSGEDPLASVFLVLYHTCVGLRARDVYM